MIDDLVDEYVGVSYEVLQMSIVCRYDVCLIFFNIIYVVCLCLFVFVSVLFCMLCMVWFFFVFLSLVG